MEIRVRLVGENESSLLNRGVLMRGRLKCTVIIILMLEEFYQSWNTAWQHAPQPQNQTLTRPAARIQNQASEITTNE